MKSFFRFLWRNRLYSIIELAGLSVSLGFVILLICYTIQQYSITREFDDREQIYVLGLNHLTNTPYGIADGIRGKIPEVEQVARFMPFYEMKVMAGGRNIIGNASFCDPEFFNLLGINLLDGSPSELENVNNVFVSESFAEKLDSDGNGAIGNKIEVMGETMTIAGIYRDFGKSVICKTDIFLNIRHPELMKVNIDNPLYVIMNVATLVRVTEGTDPAVLEEKLESVYKDLYGEETFRNGVFLANRSLTRIDKLYFSDIQSTQFNQGDKKIVNNLMTVGIVLLLCAVFNYINLNTALAGRRAREMATRRLLGTSRKGIVMKYIRESLLFTAICFAIGLAVAAIFAPVMNSLLVSDKEAYWRMIDIGEMFRPSYILVYICVYIVVSVISGIIPAVIASRFSPIDIVRGTFRLKSRMIFSRIFIVMQNIAAVVLIALSICMEAQMKHMLDRPAGCNIEDMYYIPNMFEGQEAVVLKENLMTLPSVSAAGFSQGYPGEIGYSISSNRDKEDGRFYRCFVIHCDTAAFRMFGFNIIRKYSDPVPGSMWLSEKAMKDSGSNPPYDDISRTQATGLYHDIAGVVSDFIIRSVTSTEETDYGAIQIDNSPSGILLEITGDHREAEKQIKETIKDFISESDYPEMEIYGCGFIKNRLDNTLNEVRNSNRIIELFMLLAVIISAMGLIAMSIYHATENARSIALHKIYGGTVGSEIRRTIRIYMIMTLVADIVAVPVALILCRRYLQEFAYRIDLEAWIFIVTVVISLVITAVSVLWQVSRAARANPVEALRSE